MVCNPFSDYIPFNVFTNVSLCSVLQLVADAVFLDPDGVRQTAGPSPCGPVRHDGQGREQDAHTHGDQEGPAG